MTDMVTETVFSGPDAAAEGWFDYWREACGLRVSGELSSTYATDFKASKRVLELGTARVLTGAFRPLRFERTPRLIRQSDPETCQLLVLTQGVVGITQAGRQGVCGAGDLFVVDTSRPYEGRLLDHGQTITVTGLEVPKALLLVPERDMSALLGCRIPGTEGIAALLTHFLGRLARERHGLRPSDGSRLGTIAADLLSALLARELEADEALAPEARQRALILRIQAFIRDHLTDAQLDPGAIAEAHHISLSHLHRLFRRTGTSVAAWIRGQRLEHARSDLANPALRHLPVYAVGTRSGFSHPAVFNRAFRSAYGITPGDYRHQALNA